MKELFVYILIFILAFTIHEFEEILYLPRWLDKNMKNNLLAEKVKSKFFHKVISHMNTTKFGLIVLEEYVLLIVILIYITISENNILFVGILLGYTFHTIGHVAQTLILKKYIPGFFTSVISGIVSTLLTCIIIKKWNLLAIDILTTTICVFSIIIINLLICHVLVRNVKGEEG
ncbi:HXXEE domain-containing protein [Clostridium gasigenes]|uniref:HXXEE domain-containing protein n=1 Tax=Clostridium gasigenes TaxID=94869 RepID=UPI001C0D9C8B|nr:HXXEE domain-containing protein [Clostridium gasigenes]MBU3134175.1 HXXEE domain-containing protein [Clostridium gasigenes]